MQKFEKQINEELKRRHLKVNIVFIPVPRDRLIADKLQVKRDILEKEKKK